MAKLIRIATQQCVLLINPNPADAKSKEVWAKCPEAVKSFALQNLKPGDDVDIEAHDESDGLHITKIAKAGELKVGTPVTPQESKATETSSGAGTGNPPPKTGLSMPNKYRDPVTPEEAKAMRRSALMASTCAAVSAVGSQITANAIVTPKELADYIISVYNLLLAEVEK